MRCLVTLDFPVRLQLSDSTAGFRSTIAQFQNSFVLGIDFRSSKSDHRRSFISQIANRPYSQPHDYLTLNESADEYSGEFEAKVGWSPWGVEADIQEGGGCSDVCKRLADCTVTWSKSVEAL